ncbi:hypothetical protein [Candidatus Nitrospira bockiana]
MQPARTGLGDNPIWQFLDHPDPLVLELLLIEYCALGVPMTEPVEGWIRRAGERCEALGYREIGSFLIAHAQQEKDHHRWFLDDTRALVGQFNERHSVHLQADWFLSQPLPTSVLEYRALHEEVIGGDSPYCQLAIEYEIERLSVVYGAAAMPKIAKVLGGQVIQGLRFLEEHTRQDVGHTALNEANLNQLLSEHPSVLPRLLDAARRALDCYSAYLFDCLRLARGEAARLQG